MAPCKPWPAYFRAILFVSKAADYTAEISSTIQADCAAPPAGVDGAERNPLSLPRRIKPAVTLDRRSELTLSSSNPLERLYPRPE